MKRRLKMKLVKVMLIGALVASLGLLSGYLMADVVAVSTNSVTTVSSGDTGRQHIYMQNSDTALKVYFAKAAVNASTSSGTILNTYGSIGDSILLENYTGPVYAIAQSSNGVGSQATVSVRTFKVAR
jgi:hypothetical protein